jgi:two-component system phosphate regulon sensor histidine kinase PhoR
MLSAMDEGIIAIDGAGRILFSNQAASRLLRSDLRLSRGEPLDSIPVLRMFEGVVQEAKSTGQLVNLEVKLGPPENQTYLSTKAQPFGLVGGTITQQKSQVFAAAAGALSGVVVVLHNMTNVRRLERVRRDFVANVSHELKTPLTAIKGYVEMLLGGAAADPDTSRRFLSKIDANVNRLSDLVHDILSLARIETHDEFGGVPEGARVDWRSVIQAVAAAHEDAAVSKGITLAVNLPQGPMVVTGDRESLRQILDNLAGNAIKYTQAGGKVWIEGRVSGEGAICEVSVRDSGIGIPEKHLDRIFERFYRVDKARSRELGGTGLGLSIVKNLVASLGGEIRVESNPGEGSTFTVRMKMSPRQQEESQ